MVSSADDQRRRPDWFDLFRCFRIANHPAKIWLGFLGVVFACLVLTLGLFAILEVRQLTGGEISHDALASFRAGDAAWGLAILTDGVGKTWADVQSELGDIGSRLRSGELLGALRHAPTLRKVVPWTLVLVLLLYLPWAYFGGAVSRAAAVEYAAQERIPAGEARRFAASRYSSYLWPPVAVALLVAALFAFGVLVGLGAGHLLSAVVFIGGTFGALYALVVVKQLTGSGRWGVVAGVVGFGATVFVTWLLWSVRLLWLGRIAAVLAVPLLLAVAVSVVLLCAVLIFGRGVMVSAVSFEGTDAFDAVTRAADYVLRRPWRLAFYLLVGVAYGIPCVAVVVFLAAVGFFGAVVALWAGFGQPFGDIYNLTFSLSRETTFPQWIPVFLLRAVVCGLGCMVVGWCVSFVQSFRAITYALLRKSVDLSDTSEIYLDIDSGAAPPAAGEALGADNTPQAQP